MKHLATALLIAAAAPLQAADLTLPTATVVRAESDPANSVRLPEKPWTQGTTTPGTEGAVRRSVLRLPDAALTTLQLLSPLRDALKDDGYTQVFTCADAECGGFDFRFQLDLLGEPDMHVDLGNYRYLLMRKPGGEPHSVAIVSSSSGATGFVHITEVSNAELAEITVDPTPPPTDAATPSDPAPAPVTELIATLVETGRAVLGDLEFSTGSADLNVGPHVSLDTLAVWLAANPSARIVLVGHTDAVGSLEANTSLSQRRAATVADRLISTGTDGTQIQSAGAGFLAPLASNLTPEGRAANRRVEVVLLSLTP